MSWVTYLFYGIGAIVALVLLGGIKIIRPTNRAIVETLGKYSRYQESGITYVVPLFQQLYAENITEKLADVEPLVMITKDNLNAQVDLQVYYKIKATETDVKNSFYNVDDVYRQIIQLAQTSARDVIGTMEFKDVNSKRNLLNDRLAKILEVETKNWGIQIVRVELKEITPPRDVQETMNKIIKAENEKDAASDFATARETEADGIKRAEIKKAEGDKQAKILRAEGEAKAFDLINKSFVENAQLLKQYEITQASLQDNAKVILTEKGITPQLLIGELPTSNNSKVK